MRTILCFLSFLALAAGASWHYTGDHGPGYWEDDYPICAQSSQSPININSLKATYNKDLPAFTFSGYNELPTGAAYRLKNNGHVAVVLMDADNADSYTVSGGGLPTQYVADQFHFHWGSVDHLGSEHTVNGDSYPMEVHIVHHSSNYADISAAADKDQGLAVLGFFFEIGDHNDVFDDICSQLKNITYNGDECPINAFTLFSMLPQDLTSYWRYSGSLTTPPCYESVIWTVFQNPIQISQAQLEQFRDLVFEAADSNSTSAMVDTYRPVQPLGNRAVYSSVRGNEWDRFGLSGVASAISASLSLLCVLLIAFFLH